MDPMNGKIKNETIAISQPMYFPWVGLLEQIHLADIFVHYEDVQFTRGFYNRIQVKTHQGVKWLTVPLRDRHRGQKINEVRVDNRQDWQGQHFDILRHNYSKAPFCDEMLDVVEGVLEKPVDVLADIARTSIDALVKYFELDRACRFVSSTDLGVQGESSQRLRDIVMMLGGRVYITGHGARNYLDYGLFDDSGIKVRYMQYACNEYPQLHGSFTPYVSGLDLIANCGRTGKDLFCSATIDWQEFINGSN